VLDDVTLLTELAGAAEFTRAPQWLFEHDPVCGTRLSELRVATAQHDGASYHFCSAGCATRFSFDPLRYVPAATPLGQFTDRPSEKRPQGATASAETDVESS
jgi:YHS domain-containing protein